MSGKWQHWPGDRRERPTTPRSMLLLNYHPRPTAVRFDLFSPSGRELRSETLTIDARMPRTFDLEDSRARRARARSQREGGFGSLRIWSAYKLPGLRADAQSRARASSARSTTPCRSPGRRSTTLQPWRRSSSTTSRNALHRSARRPAAARRPASTSCGRCATSACASSAGESVGLIGHNGAGKTTLLKLRRRHHPPDPRPRAHAGPASPR